MPLHHEPGPGWQVIQYGEDGYCASGAEHFGGLRIVASWGGGWDHVSVSKKGSPPTWERMCKVKDSLFDAEDWVVQFHPAKSAYVNLHRNCLHLWRPQAGGFPVPPKEFV